MPSGNKKRKFSIKKLIYNDKYLIILSIVAALIIWIATSISLSPETTKTITVPITIDFTGTVAEQLGIEYFDSTDITVDVTISCKRYLAKDISSDDISASLRTDTITSTGYQSVQILVSSDSDTDFTIESYYPTSVAGLYDVYQEQSFPIELNYTNADFCADGYVAGTTTLSSDEIIVSGPRTYISQIDRVEASITLESGLSESQTVDLSPVALDADGNQLDYITFENTVTANIPILFVSTLTPQVDLLNAPSNVASIAEITYSADSVVAGVVDSSTTVLDIGDIDFCTVSPGENVFEFDLTTLSGVVVQDGTESITVTVTVSEDYETTDITVSASDVILTVPDGYTARVVGLPDSTITIVGSADELENITSSNLVLTCDVRQSDDSVQTGTYEYTLSVSLADTTDSWVYGTYTVRVRVSADE